MAVRVVVIDGHPVTRVGLEVLLERDGRASVVGGADDAHSGYLLLDRDPDVAIVDSHLPGEDGVAATRELRRRAKKLRVLILTSSPHAGIALDAFEAGADGVAVKSLATSSLVDAVLSVAEGRRYLAPDIPEAALERERALRQRGTTPIARLSPRERAVFDLFLRGFGNQPIARVLFISVKTVATHRGHIYEKLGVHSMAELVRFAASASLLPVELPSSEPISDCRA